jgi:SAM-dependent MidA family methyltransferase
VTLREQITQEIRQRGPIPFSRYMELCLYHFELGYYSRNLEQFGKAGDFYTSSDVHAVFGRLLARQFDEMWRVLESPPGIEILELGPGRGLFAQDVLDWSAKKFPEFFHALHYSLAESSPALRRRLQATLSGHIESRKASLATEGAVASMLANPQRLKPRSTAEPYGTVEAVPSHGLPGALAGSGRVGDGTTSAVPNSVFLERPLAPESPVIVFANEFFDALPVEVLSPQGELRIAEKDGQWLESWETPSPEVLEFVDRYSVHPEAGERVEVPLLAQHYISQIAATMKCGFIIAIDYGYIRQEQLAGRHRGTVTAYRQHSVSANPYEAPGEQDITAHVNFTALAAGLEQGGMLVQPLLTQSQFLLGIGECNEFADAFEECRLPQERAKVALQLKHLVTPAGMGESFHVLIASKAIDAEKVTSLSGLTFGKIAR